MKLHIENIAKIEKADIEIDGITVIAGENSTGKSTVSKVLYCLFEAFHDLENKIISEKRSSLTNILNRNLYKKETSSIENENEFTPRVSIMNLKQIADIIMDIPIGLSKDDYANKISECLDQRGYFLENFDTLIDRIRRINEMSESQINGALINRCINLEFNSQFLPLYSGSDDKETVIDLMIQNDHINMTYNKNEKTFDIEKYISIAYEVIYLDNPYLIDKLDKNTFFYRRGNNRIVATHEDKMFDMISRDEIDLQVSIFDEILDNETFKIFEDKLQNLLNGNFIKFDGELRFQEDGIDEPIRVSNLSMGSKSLAIILKLIKNGYIKTRGIVILDEPEIHLHPKWQLYFAEILVMMQKELDLHILITTHSPYFINALEVYSAKYEIADKIKFYLAELNEENRAIFNDVTSPQKIGAIYKKLYTPLEELKRIVFEHEQ